MPASSDSPPLSLDVAHHYDDLDLFYREVWGEHVHHGLWVTGRETPAEAVRGLVEHVARAARICASHAVCDVGSGYGATARQLVRDYGAQVTAVTLSPAQHAYACACSPGAANPTYLLGDWLKNDLPDATYHAVLAIESVTHMADLGRFLSEARRVLRPGGRFVACVWLCGDRPRPWQRRRLLDPICREGRLAGLPTAAAFQTRMTEAGLIPGRFEDLSRRVRRTWSVCLRRLAGRLLADPRYRRFLFDAAHENRVFARTLPRLWLAYRTGALRYGLFTAQRPQTV